MPRVSAWLVRASLVYLAAGASLGAALLAGKGGWGLPAGGAWLAIHRELLLVGWLVQLAVGVGFWILPPVRSEAIRRRPAWRVAILLNAGLLLFAVGAARGDAAPLIGWLPTIGRSLEALAVAGFAWPLLRRSFR